jgi:hypothetical protein
MSSDKNDLWFESKVIILNIFRQIDAHENQLSFRFFDGISAILAK